MGKRHIYNNIDRETIIKHKDLIHKMKRATWKNKHFIPYLKQSDTLFYKVRIITELPFYLFKVWASIGSQLK